MYRIKRGVQNNYFLLNENEEIVVDFPSCVLYRDKNTIYLEHTDFKLICYNCKITPFSTDFNCEGFSLLKNGKEILKG